MKNNDMVNQPAVSSAQFIAEEKYWLNQLSAELVKSNFPFDFDSQNPAPVHPGDRTKVTPFELPEPLVSKIFKMTRGSDFRIHMLLTAGVMVVLHKYTGNSDILLGIPIYRQDIDGEFLNSVLAVRNRIHGTMTGKELLLDVSRTITAANQHANYPLETLLYQLKMPISGDRFPLFDIAVLLEPIHDRKYLEGLPLNMIFIFEKNETGIHAILEYDGGYFDPASIDRIIGRWLRLMEQMLFNIDRPVGDTDIFLEGEKERVLMEFNRTARSCPSGKTLHGLFEEQAEKTPDTIALVSMDHSTGKPAVASLSYRELNHRANRLALQLKKRGALPGAIIGIMVHSTLDLGIGLLGILKTGGAYLPIEPGLPADNAAYMIADSAVHVLVTDGASDREVKRKSGLQTIRLDALEPADSSASFLPASNSAGPAYIIYTSGTTGRPKGVVVEHRSAVNTIICRIEEYRSAPGVIALQLFSCAFDGFVTGFFTPISSGATLVFPGKDGVTDISHVKEAIVWNSVTHFICVPSLYRVILENLSAAGLATLKVVTLAGDMVSSDLLEITAAKTAHLEIVNEYGVSEAAVMSTIQRNQQKSGRVKIGKPVWNTRLYVMDAENRPQPVGIPGELCIAGAGVARGYLNRPELTVERFISNKVLAEGQIYKSGDRVRWLADGTLEFLGRQDNQVKIRGYRVELAEIETRLIAHSGIKQALVTAKEEIGKPEKSLWAYIVLHGGVDLSVSQLREYLSACLPAHMIPAHYVELEHIPLTRTGKTDRRALDVQGKVLGTGIEYIAPQTSMEETVAVVWKEVLKLDKVGVQDNFFDVGGNSLKIIHLNNRLKDVYQKDIPVALIFQYPTVRSFVRYMDSRDNREPAAFVSDEDIDGSISRMEKNINMFRDIDND
jgi:amino acid adenylation domain-containing protein